MSRSFLLLGACLLLVVGCADDAEGVLASADELSAEGDGADPAGASGGGRVAASSSVWGRRVALHLSDADGAGWASIEDGEPGDEAWLDRSFDGGKSWSGGSKLGKTKVPNGQRAWRTLMYEIDVPSKRLVGALRACGKAGNRREITCTPWLRARTNTKTPVDAAATALMAQYDAGSGKWPSTGWWNSANALTAIVDYRAATGNTTWDYAIGVTFDRNKSKSFTNDYMDDTAWWGLAWVRAYDVTRDARYLDMAKKDADYLWRFKDDKCGGGVWWSDAKSYKNAITNELFIKLAAAIHNRTPGDTRYLAQADEVWRWFQASGMINGQKLINDGLDGQCRNNDGVAWSYNQGVILGALVELAKAHDDDGYLAKARELADASTNDRGLHPNGVLREPCEGSADRCGRDGPSFKGIYARNLGELDRALPGRPYRAYLQRQAASLASAHDSLDQYGLSWTGPVDQVDAARQHSALEALIAAQ
ncbi:MAG: glycosyl hydrolase [Labilithrix sp.]|nr:glycosyl hydrolase [Labilithrix sp.]MCW5817501.1 glycosyl hydrolase [Labilithrix sp.]